MKVSFIVPLFNRLDITQSFDEALPASLPRDLDWELIYVDDGSTDGTRDWLKTIRRPGTRVLLNEKNLGYAGGNNRGAREATGDVLALLNNDLVLSPGWIEPMLAILTQQPRCGCVGNLQYNAATGLLDHAGIFINAKGKPEHLLALPQSFRNNKTSAPFTPDSLREVVAVTGACLLVRREIFLSHDGFDEGYINGGEDVDFCFRTAVTQHRHFVALSSRVGHHISASPGRKLRDEHNSRRLTRRWRPVLTRLALPAWCEARLCELGSGPCKLPLSLVADILGYHLGISKTPTLRLRTAVARSLSQELLRWKRLLGD